MPRAGLTAELVVDAAATLIDASGYESLSLSTLADTVGVRTPSLYKHVASLDDLRERLAVRAYSGLGAAMRSAAEGKTGREALEALATSYRAFAKAHPGLAAAAQRAPGETAGLRLAAAEATEVLLGVVRGYGIRDEGEVIHLARFARSALLGFTLLEVADGFGLPQSVDESFVRLIDLVDAALSSGQ